jgi:hypothetical protein
MHRQGKGKLAKFAMSYSESLVDLITTRRVSIEVAQMEFNCRLRQRIYKPDARAKEMRFSSLACASSLYIRLLVGHGIPRSRVGL